MKKKIMMIAVAALVAGLLVVPVIAKGPSGPAGKSNVGHLYLYEKVDSTDEWGASDPCAGWLKPWEIVEGGAWGKMKYNLSGPTFDFVFNGHGLPVGQDFTLIYYPDKHDKVGGPGQEEWPRKDIICLGEGTVNDEGNIHIAESVDMETSLPILVVDSGDCNYGWKGAKIWLVWSVDVNIAGELSGWNPTAYLFEGNVIEFEYTSD